MQVTALKIFAESLISFVLPPVCICCSGQTENASSFICNDCRSKLKPMSDKVFASAHVDYFFSLYEFTAGSEMQEIIHNFKYKKFRNIGKKFGEEAGRLLSEKFKEKFDFVIPVPLHLAKRRERTYNQSDYICMGISKTYGAEFIPNTLKRNRWTESQTKLSVSERRENVKDAFAINNKFAHSVNGRNIILVDDVVTTGATIIECARTLKNAGCGKILACSIARAID